MRRRWDLTINGSFANDHALIVDGNLTIRGSYDDYRSDPAVRIALLDNPAVTVADLSRLAAVQDAVVRTALAEAGRHAHRLPPADLARLATDPSVKALLAAARHCRAASGRASFCGTLLERRDLTADVFDTLAGVGDREDWALTALISPHTARAQIERAVPRWYDDEPEILAEFRGLRSRQPDAAWWNALATSKQPKLREIAAAHAATPRRRSSRCFAIRKEMCADWPRPIRPHRPRHWPRRRAPAAAGSSPTRACQTPSSANCSIAHCSMMIQSSRMRARRCSPRAHCARLRRQC